MLLSINEQIEHLQSIYSILDIINCNFSNIELAKVDLYVQLQKNHKPAYADNERIIIVQTQDFYPPTKNTGELLHVLQTIIQDIDISNFFICLLSTNPHVAKEYYEMHAKVSSDPVPWSIYPCKGEFEKLVTEHQSFKGKLQSLKNVDHLLQELSQEEQQLLFSDSAFCLMPWVGVNIEPNSSMRPCCEFANSVGSLKEQSLESLWNSQTMKQIRLQMLNKQPVKSCDNCYKKEALGRDSLRNSVNREFAHRIKTIDNTRSDGHLENFALGYLDVRYTNLCNLSCRSCDTSSSSSWYAVHNHLWPEKKIIKPLLEINDYQESIFQELLKQIDNVEKIYFAGGEPMMIESFYRFLEVLDSAGKHHVRLSYNTNLTKLGLKNYNILDFWQKFTHVSVGASLDAMGPRAEYLRSGTVWPDVIANARAIKNTCPHVDFYVSATTGLINAMHVPDFHQEWVAQGLIHAEAFNIQLLFRPNWMSIYHAPRALKQRIKNRYQEHLQWLQPLDKLGRASSGFASVIEICDQEDDYDSNHFWEMVKKMDDFYRTDLLDCFPELQDAGL